VFAEYFFMFVNEVPTFRRSNFVTIGAMLSIIVSISALPEIVTFAEFKSHFARTYQNSEEEGRRRQAFEESVAFITKWNAEADAGVHSFRCGVGTMADLTHDEYRCGGWE
jgi:hypothetical protein